MPQTSNFAGVESRSGNDPGKARVVIVPAPYEGSVSYGGGTARGPAAILEASAYVETHDDETGLDLEDLSFALAPEVPANGDAPDVYSARVCERVASIASEDRIPCVLGGEHSVSIGAIAGVRTAHAKTHVLSIDAHADLRDSYEGSDHSHACVGRRALEGGPLTIVGVRSYSAEEARFAASAKGLRLVPAREAMAPSFDVADLVSSLGPRVYLTFDVDGLDPSVVPATGTPEPGGLGWFRTCEILREVFSRRTVVGLDVVELAPQPGSHVSDFATARLVAKMLSYEAEAKEGNARTMTERRQ